MFIPAGRSSFGAIGMIRNLMNMINNNSINQLVIIC